MIPKLRTIFLPTPKIARDAALVSKKVVGVIMWLAVNVHTIFAGFVVGLGKNMVRVNRNLIKFFKINEKV